MTYDDMLYIPIGSSKRPLCSVYDGHPLPEVRRTHRGNIGMCIPREWVVLDLDVRNGGPQSFERLEHELGKCDTHIVQTTPTGGQHRVYRHPGFKCVGKLAAGIDVLCYGRYVVSEPSSLNGGQYVWSTHDYSNPPELPDEWKSKLRRAELPVIPERTTSDEIAIKRARAYVAATPPALSGHGGDRATFILIRKLKSFGLSANDTLTVLQEWNTRCEPPWSRAQLLRKYKAV